MHNDLAFLFPGQGSQRIGMLADAAAQFSEIGDTFTEASTALGYDLWALIQEGDAAQLNLTEKAQPALLTASVALWRLWRSRGGAEPVAMAGHSLGELSALCCAGSLDLADAVLLVQARGRAMQRAVPVGVGSMAAVIGLDDDAVVAVCAEVAAASGATVAAVNFNSPGQVVIAGHVDAVNAAGEALIAAGAKRTLPLAVSAPFHTELMAPAGETLAEMLSTMDVRAPSVPVVHNVHAAAENDPVKIRELLVQQVSAPVRWTDCMQTLVTMGCARFVECGAGKVLGGLARRIDKSLSCSYLEQPDAFETALATFAD